MYTFNIYYMDGELRKRFFCPFVDGAGTAIRLFAEKFPNRGKVPCRITGPPYQVFSKNGKGKRISLGSFRSMGLAIQEVMKEWRRKPNTICELEYMGQNVTPTLWKNRG